MDFLGIAGRRYIVFGVANKKSVAYAVTEALTEAGAEVVQVVQNDAVRENVARILPNSDIYTCDVEREEEIDQLASDMSKKYDKFHGFVHSLAFANYSEGLKPFHEVKRRDFLQAVEISCYSFINIANTFKDLLDENASVVTVSISTTRMAAEPYGYMAPVKAALDSSVVFLAKSFSRFSKVRFNSVNSGLLKTSASAGIPGYLDYYLYAEKATLRRKALATKEVANVAAFLLSDRSSGINAQHIVIDAGMSVNYFDQDIVFGVTRDH
jgi:enoyl-[acyl-carrier protein] reductase I